MAYGRHTTYARRTYSTGRALQGMGPRRTTGACAILCALPLLGAGRVTMAATTTEHAGSWHGISGGGDHIMPAVRRLTSVRHPPAEMEPNERPRVWVGPMTGSRPKGRSATWSLDYDACVLPRTVNPHDCYH
jgi:hypothetical protein